MKTPALIALTLLLAAGPALAHDRGEGIDCRLDRRDARIDRRG